MAEQKRIRKLRLSDGSVYYLYDMDAARSSDLERYLALSGGTITGDLTIDGILSASNIRVVTLDERQIPATNVLTQDVATGAIQRRSTDELLNDIGGCSFDILNDGVLVLNNPK